MPSLMAICFLLAMNAFKEGIGFNTFQFEHNARDVVAESANLRLV